jgi:hypothetical protein
MKRLAFVFMLIVGGALLAACQPPPDLRNPNYLKDQSLLTGTPCEAPCFQGVQVGVSTLVDAELKLKETGLFKDFSKEEANGQTPARLVFSGKDNTQGCCTLQADAKGIVELIGLQLAPEMKVGDVIRKFGEPKYTVSGQYSEKEGVLQMLYPDKGIAVWVVPGDAASSLEPDDPVVATVYVAPERFQELVRSATLQGWSGYVSFKDILTATPVTTPVPTSAATAEATAQATP